MGRLAVVVLLCACALAPARATDDEFGVAERLRRDGRSEQADAWLAGLELEREGRRLEREHSDRATERYRAAAEAFEGIVSVDPAGSVPYWRAARAWWVAADTLPLEAVDARLDYYGRAESLASRGIETDPGCAECMLWKFASMGRLRTTGGIWKGIRQLPEMASLLERGIALEPTHREREEDDSTLGNLHYSSAIFYRVFPEWFWVGWFLGVKGDKERALGHARSALALHPERLDYQIELGAQLVCLGETRKDPERLERGRAALERSLRREVETIDDERELAAARVMLAEPRKACGYSGDTWVEVDPDEARRVAGGGLEIGPAPDASDDPAAGLRPAGR